MSQFSRVVKDVECDVNITENVNMDISDLHNQVINALETQILKFTPSDLREKLAVGKFSSIMEDGVDFGLYLLKSSELTYTPGLVEDVMNFVFDRIEHADNDDNNIEDLYIKVRGDKSEQSEIQDYIGNMGVEVEYSEDPWKFAVQDTINDVLKDLTPEDYGVDLRKDVQDIMQDRLDQTEVVDSYFNEYVNNDK